MNISDLIRRVRWRLSQNSPLEFLRGLWFSRRMTEHGIILVTGGRPRPKVFNKGGSLLVGSCQFYEGVRLEIGRGAVLKIGHGTYINRNTVVVAEERVEIGRECHISWDVVIMDSDLHPVRGAEMNNRPVIIEDNVWVGCRCIILKGVTIGKGAIIAAGSVVTKSIPPGAVAGGVPARVLTMLRNAGDGSDAGATE